MSEVVLKCPRVLPVIGEFVSVRMPQHVRMDWEGHPGGLAEPTDHAPGPDQTHGCLALAHEHIAPCHLLPLQSMQRPKLAVRERCNWLTNVYLLASVHLRVHFQVSRADCGLMAFLYQRMRDYCIGMISSRWRAKGANVCGAGGL